MADEATKTPEKAPASKPLAVLPECDVCFRIHRADEDLRAHCPQCGHRPSPPTQDERDSAGKTVARRPLMRTRQRLWSL